MNELELIQFLKNSPYIIDSITFNNTASNTSGIIKNYISKEQELDVIIDLDYAIVLSNRFKKITSKLENKEQAMKIENKLNELLILVLIFTKLQDKVNTNVENKDLINAVDVIRSRDYDVFVKRLRMLNMDINFDKLRELCSRYNISFNLFTNEYNTNEELDKIIKQLAYNFKIRIFVNDDRYDTLCDKSYDLSHISNMILIENLGSFSR